MGECYCQDSQQVERLRRNAGPLSFLTITMTTQGRWKPPDDCRDCERWPEVSERVRVKELLERAIEQFETKITKAAYEPTVAEYVKLIQLGRELAQEDEPKEIKVTWVGPNATSESEK
jgi:hypothetical protein